MLQFLNRTRRATLATFSDRYGVERIVAVPRHSWRSLAVKGGSTDTRVYSPDSHKRTFRLSFTGVVPGTGAVVWDGKALTKSSSMHKAPCLVRNPQPRRERSSLHLQRLASG